MNFLELCVKVNCSSLQSYIVEHISTYSPTANNAKTLLEKCILHAKTAIRINAAWKCHDIRAALREYSNSNNLSTFQREVIQFAFINAYNTVITICEAEIKKLENGEYSKES